MAAQSPEVLWQASATVGEVRFGERRFVEAAQAYDLAIEIIKNETLTPLPPSKFDIEGLIERSAEARLLAANGSGPGGTGNLSKLQRINETARLAAYTRVRYVESCHARYRSQLPSSLEQQLLPRSARMPRANCWQHYRNKSPPKSCSSAIPMCVALLNSI